MQKTGNAFDLWNGSTGIAEVSLSKHEIFTTIAAEPGFTSENLAHGSFVIRTGGSERSETAPGVSLLCPRCAPRVWHNWGRVPFSSEKQDKKSGRRRHLAQSMLRYVVKYDYQDPRTVRNPSHRFLNINKVGVVD